MHQPSAANKDYGYMWWINTSKKWKDVAPDIYYAVGFGGNYIVIDHAHDLVVVTRWMDDGKMGDLMGLIERSVSN